jgi:ATP-binding cassette subfamily B protein
MSGHRSKTPTDTTRPAQRQPGLARRILTSFKPYRPQIAILGLLILITSGLGVVNPLLIQVVFDSALFPSSGDPNLNLLWLLAAVMAFTAVLTGALGVVQTYLTSRVGQQVMRDLRDALYRHLHRQSLGFFTGTKTGEVQSRIANDVGGVQTVVSSTITDLIANAVIFISTLVAMFILSWQLALVALAVVPIFAYLSRYVGEKRRAVSAEAQKSMADMTAITQETLSVSGIMLSKLFGQQEREIQRFGRENQRLSNLIVRRQMTGQAFWGVMQIVFSVSPVVVYVMAGYLLSGFGDIGVTAGTIVAFTTLQSRLYFPVGSLLHISVDIQSSMALFERIYNYLDLKPQIFDSPNTRSLRPEDVQGRVSFQNVRLNYTPPVTLDENGSTPDPSGRGPSPDAIGASPERNPYSDVAEGPVLRTNGVTSEGSPQFALDGVSFDVLPGQLAAFVGPSGAGKTSISYLIPRLYDVTEGQVAIDGIDVRDIKLSSLARLVGYVTQESYLFHASMRENLLYGNPDATEEQMVAAARAAFIHDRIMDLPDGYDTVVGERGYRLSGGERQRLAIARVILHQPRILILDEATSSLDSVSERYIQTALKPLMKGRTTIAIAHRLSTIIAADVIFVVDHGKIVEQGTHSQLLARDGFYANLYREQFQSGLVESLTEDATILTTGAVVPKVSSLD